MTVRLTSNLMIAGYTEDLLIIFSICQRIVWFMKYKQVLKNATSQAQVTSFVSYISKLCITPSVDIRETSSLNIFLKES